MSRTQIDTIQVVDSHTGGEPTRVVIAGGPSLGDGTLAERRDRLRDQYDWLRTAVVGEPRGSEVLVGALLVEPSDPTCDLGVIFFNNVGYIGMCGHGAIGLLTTQFYRDLLTTGSCRVETPVGVIDAIVHDAHRVTITNVASYRTLHDIPVEVPGYGTLHGDVAWGGNWFFLCSDHGQTIDLVERERLADCSWAIRQALTRERVTGDDGAEIDHIELFGPPSSESADSKNFVLCPGRAYDRSPCGTGTSAKLACLLADGKLQLGDVWRQESITGSIFEATTAVSDGPLRPQITGAAYVTAEATLLLSADDPLRTGIGS